MSSISKTATDLVQRIQLIEEELNPANWRQAPRAVEDSSEQSSCLQTVARLLIDHQPLIESERWQNDRLNRALEALRSRVVQLHSERTADISKLLFYTFPKLPLSPETDLQMAQRLIRPGYFPLFYNFGDLKEYITSLARQEANFNAYTIQHGEKFNSPLLLAHLANWYCDQILLRHLDQNMQAPVEILALREWICLSPKEVCSTIKFISVHKVARIAPEIAALTNLESVSFITSELRYISYSPTPLTLLTNVRKLTLNDCNLDEVPPYLLQFPLCQLILRGNKITHLNLDKLPETLDYLDCTKNLLKTFSSPVSSLTSLKDFILDENQIAKLPSEITNLTFLTFFSLSKNLLTDLPKLVGLVALRSLNLDHNRFQRTPSSLLQLPNLIALNLTGNGIKQNDDILQALSQRIRTLTL